MNSLSWILKLLLVLEAFVYSLLDFTHSKNRTYTFLVFLCDSFNLYFLRIWSHICFAEFSCTWSLRMLEIAPAVLIFVERVECWVWISVVALLGHIVVFNVVIALILIDIVVCILCFDSLLLQCIRFYGFRICYLFIFINIAHCFAFIE